MKYSKWFKLMWGISTFIMLLLISAIIIVSLYFYNTFFVAYIIIAGYLLFSFVIGGAEMRRMWKEKDIAKKNK